MYFSLGSVLIFCCSIYRRNKLKYLFDSGPCSGLMTTFRLSFNEIDLRNTMFLTRTQNQGIQGLDFSLFISVSDAQYVHKKFVLK